MQAGGEQVRRRAQVWVRPPKTPCPGGALGTPACASQAAALQPQGASPLAPLLPKAVTSCP